MRDGMPSVRKPSLAIQEGALGGTGTPNHCPSQVCSGHCGDCQSMWAENHPFFCGRRGGCTGNPVRPCAACCLLWSMPPPSESGEGPSGPCWVSSKWGAVCAWLALWCEPRGKGGVGCNTLLTPGFPSPTVGVRRSLLCLPLPLNCSWWQCAVMVWAALFESVSPGCYGRWICGGPMEEDGWMACRPWWQGWVVGPALGMARTGWHPRCFRTALVCGWWWDPVLVFLVAWLCPGIFWSPDGACGPCHVCLLAPPCHCWLFLLVLCM